jgi:hypothetical protein
MKRCPQCEFIYEDDQSLCDMDGVLLVFDSRTLPNLHALATVSAPMPEKTARRNRMVPAFATLILMLAVASVYYVSTMRNAAQSNLAPASVTTAIEAAPAAAQSSAAEAPAIIPAPSAETPSRSAETKDLKEVPPPQPKAKPAAAPTTKVATKPTPAKPEPKKDDSKVESILKKTGKLLKKPFKF